VNYETNQVSLEDSGLSDALNEISLLIRAVPAEKRDALLKEYAALERCSLFVTGEGEHAVVMKPSPRLLEFREYVRALCP
jgi:hypothetical protein